MHALFTILIVAIELNATLVEAKITKHLSDKTRMEYSMHIATAAVEHKMDPLLIAAVMYTESNFRNLKENKTHDFGLMQIHWQPRMPWLKGVSKRDLMNPEINIRIGGAELAHTRNFCLKRLRHKPSQHPWWGHYLAGTYIVRPGRIKRNQRIRRYYLIVKRRFRWFRYVRAKLRARYKI